MLAAREAQLDAYYRRTYGIGIHDYIVLYLEQDAECAICYRNATDLRKPLYVDHDHETGRVRGLLCADCNFGLGRFKDNIENLGRAIEYLADESTRRKEDRRRRYMRRIELRRRLNEMERARLNGG